MNSKCGLADISPESKRTASGLAVGDCVYDEDLDTLFVVSNIEGGKDGTVVVTDEEGETYYYDPNDKNAVILSSNEKDKPYYNIMRIVGGYDKFVKLTEDDTVFLATPVYENREKTFYHLLDEISKTGANIVTISPKEYLSYHASSEDLMIMIMN